MNREADGIYIFLERGTDDLFGGIMDAEIDNLDTGVSKCSRDNLNAAIMAIQSHLGDEYTQPLGRIACRLFTFCALTSRHVSPEVIVGVLE